MGIMTKQGHLLTGGTLAMALLPLEILTLSVGVFWGVTAPDYLEISYRNASSRNGWARVIPHRTLTHWPWLWLSILCIGWFGVTDPHLRMLLVGFSGGGFLHLLCDAMTLMGIPFWQPFGRRYSLKWFRTRSVGEVLAVLIISVVFIAIAYGDWYWTLTH